MGATLEGLLKLQDIELQIVDIRRQLARKDALVRRQSARLKEARERLEVQKQTLTRSQMDVDSLDVDRRGRDAQVSRLREQLNSVKTNKEYAAVLQQLNNEKAESTRLETRELQLMEEVDQKRKELSDREQEEQAEAARLADLEAQSEQARRTFSAKLEELQKLRREATEKLDVEVVKQFERISERYDGEVLAEIERAHPRRDEFTCGGCYMTVSAEAANAALTRDDVQTCRNCGRILYMQRGT